MDVKVKRRGWVKNAVIIFLSIMLVLTFFSNTIMNRSLAEVATQYVESRAISAKIRGTGTVVANAPYEVKIDEGRKIQSILVQVGDTVEVGQVLVKLTEDADTQLQEAIDKLEQLKYDYQVFLLNMATADYAMENREISKQREKIAELEAELYNLFVSDAEISAAQIAINSAQTAYDDAVAVAEAAAAALEEFDFAGGGGDYGALYEAYEDAKIARDAAHLQYDADYEIFKTAAAIWENKATPSVSYLEALYNILTSTDLSSLDNDVLTYLYGNLTSDPEGKGALGSNYGHFALAYATIRDAEAALLDAAQALGEAQIDGALETARDNLEAKKKEADKAVLDAEKVLNDAKKVMEDLDLRQGDYNTKKLELEGAQDALEEMIFNLSQQQKNDNKQAQKDQLDLEKLKKELDEQQELVDKLSAGEAIYEIVANASGVISSINVVAGNTTTPGETLMTIDQVDRGFTLSFSVTTEQARKLQVGDHAEVSTNSWWFDGVIDAVLTGISTNPSDPRNSKMLNFTVTGDVTGGDQLSLSIGERSQNYELVVPKSALRTDSNGTYVLLLEQKPSALGTRYYATRIDVEVIASDDTYSAISGGISAWDYVITSSSMPLEPGDQVRLSE